MKAEPRYWPAISQEFWDGVRCECGLQTLDECRRRFEALYGDPEPYMRQLVRVFVGDGTLVPGIGFVDGQLNPVVLALFRCAVELRVPHNSFTAWMLAPLPGRTRPGP